MKIVTKYWLKYFVNEGLCSLCGNQGKIDTTKTAISPTGNMVGRINYCICPNGQALRKARKKDN